MTISPEARNKIFQHITPLLNALEAAEARAEKAEKQLAEANLTSTLENSLNIINAVSEAVLGDKLVASLKIACPYCGNKSENIEDATAHDCACEKHPAVIRAQKAERAALKLAELLDKDNLPCACLNWKCQYDADESCKCSPECWLAWAAEEDVPC